MATKEDLENKINEMDGMIETIKALITNLVNEMSSAFGRYLAKIQSGLDTQQEIDKLNEIGSKMAELQESINSAINQAKIEGQ